MIETIKQIGLFMIVAQTFMHFAAGKQYEKYVKIIAGVIVLLLFVSPFSSYQEDIVEQWQEEMREMTEQMERGSRMWQESLPDTDYGMEQSVKRQLEEEIRTRLEPAAQAEDYTITGVVAEWGENGAAERRGWSPAAITGIRITLARTRQYEERPATEEETVPVMIEKIQIGTISKQTEQPADATGQQPEMAEQQPDAAGQQSDKTGQSGGEEAGDGTGQERSTQGFCRIFADILGIEEELVEVVYGGRS